MLVSTCLRQWEAGMEEEKARKGEAPARIRHAPCLTPSHPSSSACLPATTAGGKSCSLCGPSLIAGRNPRQAGPVVSRGQCAGSASAAHADEAFSKVGAGTGEQGAAGEAACRGMLPKGCCSPRAAPPAAGASPAAHTHTHTGALAHTRAHTASRCGSWQPFDLRGRK